METVDTTDAAKKSITPEPQNSGYSNVNTRGSDT